MMKDDNVMMKTLLKESANDDILYKGKTRSRIVKKISKDEKDKDESPENLRQHKVINQEPEKSVTSKSV
jgi:hypothetical protein